MRCPHGQEVGNPPAPDTCPCGFPGCACGDDLVVYLTDDRDEQAVRVAEWWQEHGPF